MVLEGIISNGTRINILFLAANSSEVGLRLDEEVKAIDQALFKAEFRDHFELIQHHAVSVSDLQELLLRHEPDIVHFSGHGSSAGEIILKAASRSTVENSGQRKIATEKSPATSEPGYVSARALSRTFGLLKANIQCVVLNACYSKVQAEAIAEHIDVVIGMSKAIGDTAAISFSTAFYRALAFGKDLELAFHLGCNQIDTENLNEHDTPQLLALRVDPKELKLIHSDVNEEEHLGDVNDVAQMVANMDSKGLYQEPQANATSADGVEITKASGASVDPINSLLEQAGKDARLGDFERAAKRAEAAHQLLISGMGSLESEKLSHLYILLIAGQSEQAEQVRLEAEKFGLDLSPDLTLKTAQELLKPVFIGREYELSKLRALAPGQWAWIQGGSGMGKTSLLKQLTGDYLPGRSGLPYATLEPLIDVKDTLSEEMILYKLKNTEETWLFDDWELIDEESKSILKRLRQLVPPARIIITSREPPPFPVDVALELDPLTQESLTPYKGAWEATQGTPSLVKAFLNDEPLHEALDDCLQVLSKEAREVCLALALLEQPNPSVVRRALGLDEHSMLEVFRELIPAGLVNISGEIGPRKTLLDVLEAHPLEKAEIGLKLARVLEGAAAFPLYQAAHAFWADDDLEGAQDAYVAWVSELLRRGFPQRAIDILDTVPQPTDIEAILLKGRALERMGCYREALQAIEPLDETVGISALKGVLFWRLGQLEDAKRAAEQALEGDTATRAAAENVLGHLARTTEDYDQAVNHYKQAANLWQKLNKQSQYALALSNKAIVRFMQGEPVEQAYRDALSAAEDNPIVRAKVLNNLAISYDEQGEDERAEKTYLEVIKLAEQEEIIGTAAEAWSNIGAFYLDQNRKDEAETAYEHALDLAQNSGDATLIAFVLANQGELSGNVEAIEEAYHLMEEAGYRADAEAIRSLLPPEHPLRQTALE